MFARALVKHNGHQTNAYLEVYPEAKYDSARHSASVLLTNAYIKQRISEILEQNGLGLKEVIKKLSDHMNSKITRTDQNGAKVFYDNKDVQLKALGLVLRLYESLIRSGTIICLKSEEVAQVEKMVKVYGASNQGTQDDQE